MSICSKIGAQEEKKLGDCQIQVLLFQHVSSIFTFQAAWNGAFLRNTYLCLRLMYRFLALDYTSDTRHALN
jgi:hypothetical protein